MERSTRATQKATKATKGQILTFAALGAAVGVVFIDFLRKSTVLSTLTSTIGLLFGAMADKILVRLLPAILPLIDAMADLNREFSKLDDTNADLAVSLILVAGGLAAIATGAAPLIGAIAILAAFAIHIDDITEALEASGKQLEDYAHIVQMLPARFVLEFGIIAGAIQGGLAAIHGFFLQLSIDLIIAARGIWDRFFGAFKGPFNIFVSGIEGVINIFSDSINATFGLIPGVPHLGRITLPRLEHGGTVERTGIAVVHQGETFFGAGSAPITVQVFVGAGALTSLALPESGAGLEDLFKELGEMAGNRAATVLRRRT